MGCGSCNGTHTELRTEHRPIVEAVIPKVGDVNDASGGQSLELGTFASGYSNRKVFYFDYHLSPRIGEWEHLQKRFSLALICQRSDCVLWRPEKSSVFVSAASYRPCLPFTGCMHILILHIYKFDSTALLHGDKICSQYNLQHSYIFSICDPL